ncbi:beta-N-acetylhexosaminidase [Niabella hibiscisoli]|uniref:beta-N-acetylhexosaminidase n=1 Tax=Niabella hibiscisoli TaxID=1825928 RepID=UPI001F0F9D38|nr:beta-N-acetylhexosaminidase [Niabella hibiscisoli]MCH5717299.1 beta-N-acetylhexosaminidase [Niabella hibiscisoli]
MTKLFSIIILLLFASYLTVHAQQSVKVIPEPASLIKGSGSFELPKEIRISAPASKELSPTIQFLQQKLSTATGYTASTTTDIKQANILLELVPGNQLGGEGYTLSVNSTKILIKANKPAGLFYGVQSLLQLLPPAIESKQPVENVKWEIPVVEIKDQPKLNWRGLMLDVSRHFLQ